jgi:hypothetical protein
LAAAYLDVVVGECEECEHFVAAQPINFSDLVVLQVQLPQIFQWLQVLDGDDSIEI